MKKMFFVMAVLVTALIGVAGCNQSHSPKTNNGGGGGQYAYPARKLHSPIGLELCCAPNEA